MSRGVNKVILIGNLGRDPEISYLPSGMAVAKFSLATSDSRRKGDNEWEEITEWHRITLFGKQAETAGQYLSKGSQAYIEGRIRYGSYERDGIKHNTVDIIGNVLRLLGRRDEGSRSGESSTYESPSRATSSSSMSQPPPPPEDFPEPEEDLPF